MTSRILSTTKKPNKLLTKKEREPMRPCRLLTALWSLLAAFAVAKADAPWGPLRPLPLAVAARAYYAVPTYHHELGLWKSRVLTFPLPKDTSAPALTDPFGGGTEIIVHFENYGERDWCYPVPGAHVTSPYGWRGERGHSGTDIKTFGEDRICAAFEGVVVASDHSMSGYGNCIVISHSNGLKTLYSHNLRNMVSVGDHVTAGQVIALIGRTGHATGDHLHFECRVEGAAFNSSLVFDHDTNQLRRQPIALSKNGTARIVR